MKLKPNLDEYIKKQDVEKIYDYQKKVFDSKIEDLQSNINKIEDCLSLRFGDNLNNKYDIELEEIKKQLDDLINNTVDNKKIEIELNKLSYKVQLELENKIREEKENLNNFNKETTDEINKIIEKAKIDEEKISEQTEKYLEELKLKLNEIAKDGRSRTAIGKQEKTIKALKLSKDEIFKKIESVNILLNQKIDNLNYDETIKNINESIRKIEEENIIENENNKEYIKRIDEKLKKELEERIEQLDYIETIENLKNNADTLKEEVDTKLEYTDNKIQLVENTLQNQLEEKINGLDYTGTISKINEEITKIKDSVTDLEIQNENKISKVESDIKQEFNAQLDELNYNDTIDDIEKLKIQVNNIEMQMQALLSIVANIEDKYSNIISLEDLQKAEIESIIDKKMKAIETKYNKLFENKLKVLDNTIKSQEKIIKNRNEIRKYNENIRRENINNTRYQIPIQNQNYNTNNIYSSINVQEEKPQQVAEPVYNQELENMLKKLKNTKIDTKRIKNSINNINQILGYSNNEDADY